MPTLYAKTYNSDGFNQHYLQLLLYLIQKYEPNERLYKH